MNKTLSTALFVVGVISIVGGIKVSESVASDFSRLCSGSPTAQSAWMLTGGIVAAVIGTIAFAASVRKPVLIRPILS